MAKRIVRKYGKKDALDAEDCIKLNNRRASKSFSKSPQKEKRWSWYLSTKSHNPPTITTLTVSKYPTYSFI